MKQRSNKRFKSKSLETKEILVERLNKVCLLLHDLYYINSGGCCYIAYCFAKLLKKDNFRFNVVIYETHELKEKEFNNLSEEHYHYAISIGGYVINSDYCDEDEGLYKKVYHKVKVQDILNHYYNNKWNECYDTSKNDFIFKIIKNFYNDLTEDLREG